MNQYDNRKNTNGRSRARGSSHPASGQRGRSTTSASAPRNRQSQYSYSGNYGKRPSGRKKKPDYDYLKIFIAGVLLIVAIAVIVFLVKGIGKGKNDESSAVETEETTEPETELEKEVMVDGISITGMSRENAKNELLKNYTWSMTAAYNGDVYEIPNLMSGKIDNLLQEIYTGEPKESYTLDTSGLEEAVANEVEIMAARWDKKAKNGSISSYDEANDKFLFTGAEQGLEIDREKLTADISQALASKDFKKTIAVTGNTVEPEFSEATAKEKYKTLSTFTTKTTSNQKRNTNVKLSAQAINGTILHPGEEFSFNDVVGERTVAKGYKGAAAYNNGEVVEEIGGGVCQTSSTLYNAVVRAGLKTTVRRSHTYEPSYVTPGMDATVSWGGPDYKFVNNSNTAIGIRAHYQDQTVTISIYGIPLFEDGVKYDLKSTKLKDADPPAPTYEEDQTLQPGVEKTKSSGSRGSSWETKLVVTKNGEVISEEVDHRTTYKGHAPVILRNTSGVVITPEGESSSAGESVVDPSQETTATQPSTKDGEDQPEQGPGAGIGPGMTTEAPSVEPLPESTTAAPAPGTSEGPAGVPGPAQPSESQNVIVPNPMTGGGETNIPAGPGM